MLPFPEALGQKRGDALGGVSVCVLIGQLCELQALGPQRIVARCKLGKKRPEIVRGVDVKILGNGEFTKKLTIQANAFSAKAAEKIESLGGKAEVI